MPESTRDRPTSATEKIYLLTKNPTYFYDQDAYRVPVSSATISRDIYSRITSGKDGPYSVQHDHETPSNPAGRNLWNWWEIEDCDEPLNPFWKIGPEPFRGSHFAVYPSEIPRRAIKLGTSEKGCCPACGVMWRRVVERVGTLQHGGGASRQKAKASGHGNGATSCFHDGTSAAYETKGWRPGCDCNAGEPEPCRVLDCFNGSGTTGKVCEELGRHYIGIDLNAEYLAIARRRLDRPHAPVVRAGRREEAPLFAGLD